MKNDFLKTEIKWKTTITAYFIFGGRLSFKKDIIVERKQA